VDEPKQKKLAWMVHLNSHVGLKRNSHLKVLRSSLVEACVTKLSLIFSASCLLAVYQTSQNQCQNVEHNHVMTPERFNACGSFECASLIWMLNGAATFTSILEMAARASAAQQHHERAGTGHTGT